MELETLKRLSELGTMGLLLAGSVWGNVRQYLDGHKAKDDHAKELLAVSERLATVTEKSLGAVEAARAESRENQSTLRSVLESLRLLTQRRF